VTFTEFIQDHFASLVFSLFFFSLILWVIRMNFENGPYKHFQLAHLVMKKDGTLDRKAFFETILFLSSVYGFVHVIQKRPEIVVEYFLAMTGVWLAKHVAQDKLPNLGVPQSHSAPPSEDPKP
jgi:hypothetical protein